MPYGDPFNSFGDFGFGQQGGFGGFGGQQQSGLYPSGIPRLTPEEEESLLAKLTSPIMGGLSFAGGILNKPGRAIRGLIGGLTGNPEDFREALNVIPFSDKLGFTDPTKEVTGRSLLERAGVLDKNTPGLDWGDVAGFAADVFTDPLSYIGSPLTGAGKLAKSVGLLPKAGIIGAEEAGRVGGLGVTRDAGQLLGPRLRGMAETLPGVLRGSPELAEPTAVAAQKLGINIADVADQPLRGFTGFDPLGPLRALTLPAQLLGMPALAEHTIPIGTGPLGAKLAGAMDELGLAARFNPVSREVARLFQHSSRGARSMIGQLAGKEATTAQDILQSQAKGRATEYADILAGAKERGAFEGQAPDLLTRLVEGKAPEVNAAPWQSRHAVSGLNADEWSNQVNQAVRAGRPVPLEVIEEAAAKGHAVVDPEIVKVARGIRNSNQEIASRYIENGIDLKLLDDNVEYLRAQINKPGRPTPGFERESGKLRELPTADTSLTRREDVFRGIPYSEKAQSFGRTAVNMMAQDERLSGVNKLKPSEAAQVIRTEYNILPTAEEARLNVLRNTGASNEAEVAELAALEAKDTQANKLAQQLSALDPQYVQNNLRMFVDPIEAQLNREMIAARTLASSDAIYGAFGRGISRAATEDSMPLDQALKRAGFTSTGYEKMAKTLEKQGIDLGLPPGATAKEVREAFKELHVPNKITDDALRMKRFFDSPDEVRDGVKALNQFTNLFRAGVYTFWPGSTVVRNGISGAWNNLIDGSFKIGDAVDAYRLLKGKDIKGLAKAAPWLGETDKDATRAFARIIEKHSLVGKSRAQHAEVVGGQSVVSGAPRAPASLYDAPGGRILAGVPGEVPLDIGQTLKQGIPRVQPGATIGKRFEEFMPWNTPGGGIPYVQEPPREMVFGPGRALAGIGQEMEAVNRIAPMLNKIKRGIGEFQAQLEVKGAQVDYSRLTPFEKNVMRVAIPFYSFTRLQMPWTMEQLLSKPGGPLAQTVHAINRAKQGEGFLPEYVAETSAIPLGEEKAGTRRYLTGLGLPIEQTLGLFTTGPTATKTVERTLGNVLGQTNPLLKLGLELGTGKQLYTGRRLEDLYGPTGNVLADQLIMNSPLSRVYTTGRTWGNVLQSATGNAQPPFDQIGTPALAGKAALASLTGSRISDINMERAREVSARERITDTLRGQEGIGHFETLYPQKDAQLTPEQQLQLAMLNALSKRAARRKKEQAGR